MQWVFWGQAIRKDRLMSVDLRVLPAMDEPRTPTKRSRTC